MYSEIIYTRCGDGIDINRNEALIVDRGVGGFKVHSCTKNSIVNSADLTYLTRVIGEKQSYVDPGFMDDAYLYYVPDSGEKLLVNFHPIHFDRTVKSSNYPRRPGNYINQIFLGSFEDEYPYESFGSDAVWDAKSRGEAFYYENGPLPLERRSSIVTGTTKISADDIKNFVSEGRRELLKSAVSFIISQYALNPEDRKFLVIIDENTSLIELWIAAIESAFSPRMAAGLSFATRMDKFSKSNKYTVNNNGQYQNVINLQSKDHKLRYHAMVVGVDARDKSNLSDARVLPGSPYVVLDGRKKSFSMSLPADDPYFELISTFDRKHLVFCREFLQSVKINVPSEHILKLFKVYSKLDNSTSEPLLNDVIGALRILDTYTMVKTPYFKKLYDRIKLKLRDYFTEDSISVFFVLSWLNKTALMLGDVGAKESFKGVITDSFISRVYEKPHDDKTKKLANMVEDSAVWREAAAKLISEASFTEYSSHMDAYKAEDWLSFTELYARSLKEFTVEEDVPSIVKKVFSKSMQSLFRIKDDEVTLKVISIYSTLIPFDIAELLFKEAASDFSEAYANYIVPFFCRIMLKNRTEIDIRGDLWQKFQAYNLKDYYHYVLAFKAESITKPQKMVEFIETIQAHDSFKDMDLTAVLSVLDEKLSLIDRSALKIAKMIQEMKKVEAICTRSAHILALDLISDEVRLQSERPLLQNLISQGFPSIKDSVYADYIVNNNFLIHEEGLFRLLFEAAEQSEFYADCMAKKTYQLIDNREDEKLLKVFGVGAEIKAENFSKSLIRRSSEIKHLQKKLDAVRPLFKSGKVEDYFASIEKGISDLASQNKGTSFFGKLFSRGSGSSKSENKD